MPRVHFVKKARKADPNYGIEVGDSAALMTITRSCRSDLVGYDEATGEHFLPVNGWSGYWIGDSGTVRSYRTQGRHSGISESYHDLNPMVGERGYPYVELQVSGRRKTFYVHQLVLTEWEGPCPLGCETRHLDGNRNNARRDNLCWGTKFENQNDRITHGTDNRWLPAWPVCFD